MDRTRDLKLEVRDCAAGLFETDYPHPTCQAPGPASIGTHPRLYADRALRGVPEATIRKVLQDTAAEVYGIR